jgi:hypothetical protein
MQTPRSRYVVLIALLVSAIAVTAIADPAAGNASPRWPADPAALQVAGWDSGAPTSEEANGTEYVSRDYRNSGAGLIATLTITTSPVAKRVYRAGPEVPFLGNGYDVDPAPQNLVPAASDRGALIARRGEEAVLAIHTYGERRGRFDNGVLAWGLNVLDTTLDRPNDYYLARVVIRLGSDDDAAHARLATSLADALFPQIAAWYSQA